MIRRFSPVARAVAGYGLLLLSWLLSIPPFSSPDEWAHYLRAIGLAQGSWIGQKVAHYDLPDMPTDKLDFLRQTVRAVRVPAGMSPLGYACQAQHPDQSARCNDAVTPFPKESEQLTVVGVYPPTFYLVPALLVRVASTPLAALRILRGAGALTCLFLLMLALLCAYDAASGGGCSLLGVAIAATPMVLFLGASLTPSGPEIFAGIAFGTSLLRLLRDDESPPRWIYVVAAFAGTSLALARSLGAFWVALYLFGFVAVGGISKLRSLWAVDRAPLLALAVTLALACGGNRLWEAAYGARVHVNVAASLIEEMIRSRLLLAEWIKEAVGNFQYLDTPMPSFAYNLYALAFALLAMSALWRATSREGLMFAFCALSVVLVPLALYCAVVQSTGFGLQGRYILPFVVIAPLLAGELLRRHWSTMHWLLRAATLGSVVLVIFLQFVGVYANGRRSAVGLKGPRIFVLHPEWSPPGGWPLCLALAVSGCALLAWALAAGCRVAPPAAAVRRGVDASDQSPS
jgi:hypothetical protein